MSKQINPFSFELTKLFSVDPQEAMAQWQKSLENIQVPGVDMASILASQRKNVETLAQANRTALEGLQAVLKRQQELLQQSVEEATRMFREFDPATAPADQLARQTEMTREAFEKALVNMQELAELASRAQKESLEAIQKRFAESLEEIKAQVRESSK